MNNIKDLVEDYYDLRGDVFAFQKNKTLLKAGYKKAMAFLKEAHLQEALKLFNEDYHIDLNNWKTLE